MEKRSCKSTRVFHGEVYRCEGLKNHNSAHFSKGLWWANENGLPKLGYSHGNYWWIGLIVTALVVLGGIAFLLWMR